MLRHALLFMFILPLCAPFGISLISKSGQTIDVAEEAVADVASLSESELLKLASIAPAAAAAVEPRSLSLNDLVVARLGELDVQGDQEAYCLGQAVYFEARSEPLEGQLAVAQVVLNRVADKRYPDSICQVVFQNDHMPFRCQFSFACDGVVDRPYNAQSWKISKAVASIAMDEAWADLTHASTHYHAVYVAPYWRSHLEKTVQLGAHIFYRS